MLAKTYNFTPARL